MIRLLIETHIPARLVQQLQLRELDAVTLQDWQGGLFRGAADHRILVAAYTERRVPLTFDRRTFPPLVRELAANGHHHAGIVLAPCKTFAPNDVGGMLRALIRLIEREGEEDWEDRMTYLTPVEP